MNERSIDANIRRGVLLSESALANESSELGSLSPMGTPEHVVQARIGELESAITRAWASYGPGNFENALGCWRVVAREFPWHHSGHIGIVLSKIKLGDLDGADDLLRVLRQLAPTDPDVLMLQPQLTAVRHGYLTAFEEWKSLRSSYPDHVGIRENCLEAQWHVRLQNLEAENAHAPVQIAKVQDPEARALVMQFESMGDNCELGLVQRHFEAEPLGLLRWTAARPGMIAALLENRLAGIGDFANTLVGKFENGEYWLRDTLYGMGPFHTFMSGNSAEPEVFHRDHSRRMRRLRERFLEDLAEGHKIFVYKATISIDSDDIERLHRAIRAYGRNTLMIVQAANEGNPAGSVRGGVEGLIFGYLRHTSPQLTPQGGVWNIPFDEWISIFRQALDLAI